MNGARTRRRLLATAITATVGLALWMANREPFRFGVLFGAVLAVVASGTWTLWLLPPSAEGEAPSVRWGETPFGKRSGELLPPLAFALLAFAVLVTGAALGGYAHLPVTILLSLVCLVPPALRRPGLLVILLVAALYLPLLGATGLWDPWETHYGEVAREILARNDWLSLWWAQDKWFWSKPVLLFWMEALSMGAFGMNVMPDANPAHPEWAVRLPVALTSLVAIWAVYEACRRRFGRRAASLAAIAAATMPLFFFASHQAITDLPLTAAIAAAMAFLLTAIELDPGRRPTGLLVGRARFTPSHAVLFALFVLVLPQALYLISRNFSWMEGYGLVMHVDRFLYGSAGNLDVPGNPTLRDQTPYVRGLLGQPFVQGLLWLGLLAGLAAVIRREERSRALAMHGFYIACALAFMAKGLPGIAIPGAAALFYLVASGRWGLLGNGQLRISIGIFLVATVSLPWYLAMFVRHGPAFTNRLLIHDHINRLAAGVHGDTGTIAYFLGQLGYATFPWIALLPVALVVAVWVRARPTEDAQRQAVLLWSMWLLSSFVLFSAMVTKYHHYILPTLVPAGLLIGVALDALWGPNHRRAALVAVAASVLAVLGFAWLTGDPRGLVPSAHGGAEDWVLRQSEPLRAALLLAAAAALAIWARADLSGAETRLGWARSNVAVGVAVLIGAALVAFVGRDLSWVTSARPQGNERLVHLFVYNYERPWPGHLDYRAILSGFAIAATLFTAAAAFVRWRAFAARALTGVAIAFCAWSVNVYMVDASAHWGVRNLAKRYYELRRGPEEPLLAWQMNWKGENFYTGNRVHVFPETDNERFLEWIDENRGRTVYVVLQHQRLARFRRLVPDREVRELTSLRDNNKLLLVTLEI